MVGKGLTERDMLEIVYKSDVSFSDSSNDNVSSSNNETDDATVADSVINDDSDDEEEISHQEFMLETKDNYTGHREVFNCDSGPRFGTENVSDIVECFEFFFYKEIIQQILRKINRYKEQYKNAQDNLFPIFFIWEIEDTCNGK